MWLNDMWDRLNLGQCWSTASSLCGLHSVGAFLCSVHVFVVTHFIPFLRSFILLNFVAFPLFTCPLVRTGCIKLVFQSMPLVMSDTAYDGYLLPHA